MRFSTDTYDGIARRLASQNPNMLVPWWLMAAFMYEVENDPFLSDGCFDWLSAELFSKWDEVEHRPSSIVTGCGPGRDWLPISKTYRHLSRTRRGTLFANTPTRQKLGRLHSTSTICSADRIPGSMICYETPTSHISVNRAHRFRQCGRRAAR
jgi:hypothetical protein